MILNEPPSFMYIVFTFRLDEMLKIQDNDPNASQKQDMLTIYFQQNPSNVEENARNYLEKKLLAIFYVYMSPGNIDVI